MIAAGLVLAGCGAGESQPTSYTHHDTRASLNQQISPSVARRAKIQNATTISSAKPSSASPGASVHAAKEAVRCDTVSQCELLQKGVIAEPAPSNSAPLASSETKKDTVPPATDKFEADLAGTHEPSSKVQGTEANAATFVNRVLAVPGAPTNAGTLPAKFSARAAAPDDALPIAGYVLKHLTDEQRRVIFQSVRGNQVSKIAVAFTGSYTMVGALVPSSVALDGLRPLPQSVVATLAGTERRDVHFVR